MNLSGLSFRDLEYVVAVAENLHFGRAALACSVSQPTLSAQIKKLEEYLGFDIFERANRTVLVTERGQGAVAQARIILAEGRRLMEQAQASGEPLSGTFRLGVISTLGPYLLPLLLRPLREQFPKLRLLISEGLAPNRVAATAFGDTQPLDPGDAPDAFARNRRIELRLTDR